MKVTEIDKLVNINGKDIYNFCRQLTQNKEEADELYQDTFLKAIELCHKIDKDNNPKSYLMSIAVRLWKNRKRKIAWRLRIAPMESHQEELEYNGSQVDEIHNPEEELLKKEQETLVAKSIGNLKEEYRVPMYLYYAAEMPLKEISRILHLPEGTIKSRLHKARNEVNGYDG